MLLLASEDNIKLWRKYESSFKKYFELKVTKDKPYNIKKYLETPIDILFLDDLDQFELQYYKQFKTNEHSFSYVALYGKMIPHRDIETYQTEIVDRIIYTKIDEQFYKWSIISVLRRFWSSYSKPSTIIYKNIIADFIEQKFWTNKKQIELTPKESSILRLLLINKNEYVKKAAIFKQIWGHTDDDTTRTVDQTLFKLKRKMGKDLFVITRNKGVMLK